MRRRDRFLAVLVILLFVAGAKLAQQTYRYYAYRTEREGIAALEHEVRSSGLGVISTQLRADTLRRRIDASDETLREGRRQLDLYERQLTFGSPSRETEAAYREALAHYNRQVDERNALFRAWRETVDSNHVHVDRYNLLADSIRRMANRMGEPYYPVLTPAEIAARREQDLTLP